MIPVQFNERRGFERVFLRNPFEQEKHVSTLVGTIALHSEFGPLDENSAEVIAAAKLLVVDFSERFPEFLLAHTSAELDSEMGYPDYTPDERLVSAVDAIRVELTEN